jgi:CubicO group peptidase (beta-lactamase class C family)
MRKDDIFRMMSASKPVTALAVLMMMEKGKLSLDDKVSRFIPEFKNPRVAIAPPGAKGASQIKLVPADREITIKDLLTHTSGLTGGVPGLPDNKVDLKPDDTLATYIPRVGSSAVLEFQPGTKWGYSPLQGFDVLLRIVEITSGMSADEFMSKRIFKPLDMRDTYFNVPPEKADRIVNIYGKENGNWKVVKHLFGDGPYKYLTGGGGLFSTVHDFMQFEAMLLNRGTLNGRRLLKPETVALMSRNQVGSLFAEWIPAITSGLGFGLGVGVVQDRNKSFGRGVGSIAWGGAYGTESWADPEHDVAAAVFFQVYGVPGADKTELFPAIRKAFVALMTT